MKLQASLFLVSVTIFLHALQISLNSINAVFFVISFSLRGVSFSTYICFVGRLYRFLKFLLSFPLFVTLLVQDEEKKRVHQKDGYLLIFVDMKC